MKVKIVKEVIACDVSPVAMFVLEKPQAELSHVLDFFHYFYIVFLSKVIRIYNPTTIICNSVRPLLICHKLYGACCISQTRALVFVTTRHYLHLTT